VRLAKRIFLFVALNFLVVATISLVLNLLNIRPFLSAQGIDLSSLLTFCLVWGMGGALISLALSKTIAKWMMGVRVIEPHSASPEERHLVEIVRGLARTAGLKTAPEVGIFRSPEPNAFATGPSQNRSLVAISTGLAERMSEAELKAVLGHEIAHIANGDMVTMTLLQGVVNAFVMFLARILAYALSGLGRNREQSSGGSYGTFMALTYLFEIVFMILGSLLVCAYSRWREFRADAGGARLAGREAMIGALQTLKTYQEIRDPKADNPAIAAFKIATPVAKKSWLHYFATHPPIDERIERLQGGAYTNSKK
jgi:heat shock protein HtpX